MKISEYIKIENHDNYLTFSNDSGDRTAMALNFCKKFPISYLHLRQTVNHIQR